MMARRPTTRPKPPGAKHGPSANKLDDAIRTEIVTRLALYDRVTAIHTDLVKRGVDVSIQAVGRYNPANNTQLAKRWCDLFEETRVTWRKEQVEVPIANKSYRLRGLQAMFEAALDKGALVLAAGFLEQAAKESGGLFTNVSKVKTDSTMATTVAVTIDEKRNMLSDRIKQAVAAAVAQSKPKGSGETAH